MRYLLIPGRHLVNTKFQAAYIKRLLLADGGTMAAIWGKHDGQPVSEIVFAVTSANQDNSRHNPIPFHIRTIGVDRFAMEIRREFPSLRHHIFGIPHYNQVAGFASMTIKEISAQSDGDVSLTPENCLVMCSTPEVNGLYYALGFPIALAEAREYPMPPIPAQIISAIGKGDDRWIHQPHMGLAESHRNLFEEFPSVPRKIRRLFQDPLTTETGDLTPTRNYSIYARGMNEIIRRKYEDIRPAIKAGRIADEGCSDGALLREISKDFQDSDLLGVDISSEFGARFNERLRSGEYGSAYVHFYARNLLDRIFEPDSIDTTICNSTLHEIWSYGGGESAVRSYLQNKFAQLRPGGRLVIRDVVGPENGDRPVLLFCEGGDGVLPSPEELVSHPRTPSWLAGLSTHGRFLVFIQDCRKDMLPADGLVPSCQVDGKTGFQVTYRLATEFLSKKDYFDNWVSEMKETFAFWSLPQWKQALRDAGFEILTGTQTEPLSRVSTNEWIIKNRYEGKARITDALTQEAIPFPPTNMLLAAAKPS